MKRFIRIMCLAMVLVVLASCSQDVARTADTVGIGKGLGYVSFNSSADSNAKGLSATIEYIDAETLFWDVLAVKEDGGEHTGEGLTENALLTDRFGAYSIGEWSFTLSGHDEDGNVIYTGETTVTIKEGENAVLVNVTPVQGVGNVVFRNCNFRITNADGIQIGELVNTTNNVFVSLPTADLTLMPNGRYRLDDVTRTNVNAGVHTYRVRTDKEDFQFKIRVVGGMTTVVSYGLYQGVMGLSIVIEKEDGLVTAP